MEMSIILWARSFFIAVKLVVLSMHVRSSRGSVSVRQRQRGETCSTSGRNALLL